MGEGATLMDYATVYSRMHEAAPKDWAGYTCCAHVDMIASLVKKHATRTMLDYGCGKGYQYLGRRIHEQWGGILPTCYDVGVRQLNAKPTGTFDGVICCDVLEHIEEHDVDAILADIFGYAKRFVFLSIACVPAKIRAPLPDGRNVHVTVKPPDWWRDKIEKANVNRVDVGVSFDTKVRA